MRAFQPPAFPDDLPLHSVCPTVPKLSPSTTSNPLFFSITEGHVYDYLHTNMYSVGIVPLSLYRWQPLGNYVGRTGYYNNEWINSDELANSWGQLKVIFLPTWHYIRYINSYEDSKMKDLVHVRKEQYIRSDHSTFKHGWERYLCKGFSQCTVIGYATCYLHYFKTRKECFFLPHSTLWYRNESGWVRATGRLSST